MVPEKVWKTDAVYGISRDLPLNYVERPQIDKVFVDNLTRDKHIVIYGSSKQGKTSLRKHCLQEDDYVVVSCLNTMTLSDLHGAVLKATGYQIMQTTTRTTGNRLKFDLTFKGKGKVPFIAEAEGGGGVGHESEKNVEITTARLEVDLTDVNDILLAFKEADFNSYIILEDFHYLPIKTQRDFSFALKSFHENGTVCFIIVGVWREKNRLVYFNGDLTNRVVSIDVDSKAELMEVIKAGEALLNVRFDERFCKDTVESCFESVFLVQETCHHVCKSEGVVETTDANRLVGAGLNARTIIKEIVDEQAGRYNAFLNNFSEGFQQTDLEMYKWLLYAVISSSQNNLERGLRRGAVSSTIKSKHPVGQKLNEGNVTQALINAADLQVTKDIRPIILDYDQTNKVLNVVDKSFLIWLAYQNPAELIADLGIAK